MLKPLRNTGMGHVRGTCIENDSFKKTIKAWGASLVGFGDVREGLVREFRHIPVAISLAIAHPCAKEAVVRRNSVTAYSNQFPAIDAALENIQKRTVSYLRSLGWKAFAIPPDTDKIDTSFAARLFPLFPHKTAATCAGLGWIGKNGLLINGEYGARLSWGTVLTDAPLVVSDEPYLKSECRNCQRCIRSCPAGALKGVLWSRENPCEPLLDVERCAKQLEYHQRILGKAICAHCIVACPAGRKKKLCRTK